MAERRTPPSGEGAGNGEPGLEMEPIDEDNIEKAEKETIDKVNKAITALEKALAEWEGSSDKPEDMKDTFIRYQGFHDSLALWETKMLRTPGEGLDFFSRVDRLWEFVKICRAYA